MENSQTVPSIETLEKLARALEVPMYQLFYDGEQPPEVPSLPKGMQIIPVYDRSQLILAAIATLKEKLIEVCVVFVLPLLN